MEEEAEKGKRTKSGSPLQVYSVNGRRRQRPPEAKAERHCGKAPAGFSAVWRAVSAFGLGAAPPGSATTALVTG